MVKNCRGTEFPSHQLFTHKKFLCNNTRRRSTRIETTVNSRVTKNLADQKSQTMPFTSETKSKNSSGAISLIQPQCDSL
jgi:hypothetical protein